MRNHDRSTERVAATIAATDATIHDIVHDAFRRGAQCELAALDVSQVTNMDWLFAHRSLGGVDLSSWDVSRVITMRAMFINARFTHVVGLERWNVSRVCDMSHMFSGAKTFNEPIGAWNTAAVTTMHCMFFDAHQFNQPIGRWNTAAVTAMTHMFRRAVAFNQPIGAWSVSNVRNFGAEYFFECGPLSDRPFPWTTPALCATAHNDRIRARERGLRETIADAISSAPTPLGWLLSAEPHLLDEMLYYFNDDTIK